MKGNNIVVASVAFGIATSPCLAYQFRPTALLFDSSREDWFVSALMGGEGSKVFWFTCIACAVGGLILGLLAKRVLPPAKDGGAEPALLRTPIAAAILVPVGIATILLVSYNHTAQILDGIVWPEFYSKNWIWCSVVAAVVGYILAELLNTWERAFPQASFLVKAEIICCSPLAACVGLVVMAGLIGSGLLGGFTIGRFYGCPITLAWTGTCIAVVALAAWGSVFWPAYLSLAAPEGGK